MAQGILITGGGGLLAVYWAAAVRHRFKVTLGLHVRRIVMHGVACRVVNLDTVDSVVAAIQEAGAHLVVHCAAMTNVDACEMVPEAARHANIIIASNVAQACKLQDVKLVHISTDHVFSGINSMMEERSAIEPINVYAQTKAASEIAVLDKCPKAIIVRTNFFGWGLPYRQSFSDTIINKLRSGVTIDLFKDVFFTPILMDILIQAVHELVEADEVGIFHVVGEERLSKYEFGLRIAKTFRLDASLINPTLLVERSDLAPRPLDLSLDNSKLRAAIGHSIGNINSQLLQLLANEGRDSIVEEKKSGNINNWKFNRIRS